MTSAQMTDINGQQDISITIKDGESASEYVSNGAFKVGINQLAAGIEIMFKIGANDKLTVESNLINLNFQAVTITADNAKLNGAAFPWDLISAALKGIFDAAWPTLKPQVEDLTKNLLNEQLAVRSALLPI